MQFLLGDSADSGAKHRFVRNTRHYLPRRRHRRYRRKYRIVNIIIFHNHLHNPNICCTFAVANVLRGKGAAGNVYA